MTVADTNVRPAWRSPARSAHRTRRFGLARLLLNQFGRLLRKLDLTFLLLLVVLPTPACILPVGPEWQDPLGAPNAPPQILDPDPDWGEEAIALLNSPKDFKFFATDVNVVDKLYVKWIVNDTALFSNDSGIDRSGPRTLVERPIGCNDIQPQHKSQSQHSVFGVLADRPFVLGAADPRTVESPGHYDLVPWTLNLTCQSSQ